MYLRKRLKASDESDWNNFLFTFVGRFSTLHISPNGVIPDDEAKIEKDKLATGMYAYDE